MLAGCNSTSVPGAPQGSTGTVACTGPLPVAHNTTCTVPCSTDFAGTVTATCKLGQWQLDTTATCVRVAGAWSRKGLIALRTQGLGIEQWRLVLFVPSSSDAAMLEAWAKCSIRACLWPCFQPAVGWNKVAGGLLPLPSTGERKRSSGKPPDCAAGLLLWLQALVRAHPLPGWMADHSRRPAPTCGLASLALPIATPVRNRWWLQLLGGVRRDRQQLLLERCAASNCLVVQLPLPCTLVE